MINLHSRFTKLFFVLVVLLFGSLFTYRLIQTSYRPLKEVDVRANLVEKEWDTNSLGSLMATPDQQKHYCLTFYENELKTIDFNFKEATDIGGVSMFFSGNWQSISSYSPRIIQVVAQDSNNKPQVMGETEGNDSHVYRATAKSDISTRKISITLGNPYFGESPNSKLVCIQDLKFYSKDRFTLGKILELFNIEKYQSLILYWVAYLILFLYVYIPGYGILSFVENRRKKHIENYYKIILSPLVSIIILAATTLVYLLLGNKFLFWTFPIFWILTVVYLIKIGHLRMAFNFKLLISIFLPLFIIFLIVARRDYVFNLPHIGPYLDSQKPIPVVLHLGYQSDNTMPWGIARVLLNRLSPESLQAKNLLKDTTVYERTPLLPLTMAAIAGVFGESHFYFERFLEILAALSYGAFFVLFRKLLTYRQAFIVLLLSVLNVPYTILSFNTELYYKYFAVYPIVLFLIYFFQSAKRNPFIPAILIGTSFLIHPGVFMIILPIGFIYLLEYKFSISLVKQFGPILALVVILFIAWVMIPKILPVQETGKPTSYYFNELQKWDNRIIETKFQNLLALFIPNPMLLGENGLPISVYSPVFRYEFLRYSLIANLSPLFLILILWKVVPRTKDRLYLLLLGWLPLLFYWLIYLNQKNQFFSTGSGYFLLYPYIIPVLLAYAVNSLATLNKWFRLTFVVSYIVTMGFSLFYLSDLFNKVQYSSYVIYYLSWSTLLIYAVISMFLLWLTFNLNLKETN